MLGKQEKMRRCLGLTPPPEASPMLPLFQQQTGQRALLIKDDPKHIMERINAAYANLEANQPIDYTESQMQQDWETVLNGCQDDEAWAQEAYTKLQTLFQAKDQPNPTKPTF